MSRNESDSLKRDTLFGCCPLRNARVHSPGAHMVGSSGDSALKVMRVPRSSDSDYPVRNITLSFSPESASSSSGINGTPGPCLNDGLISPHHCSSLLPFSADRDRPLPILPHLSPRTEGEDRVSFVTLSSNGLVGRNFSSRDMRIALLRQPQPSTSSTTSSSSSSSTFPSSPSLSSVSLVKPSLEVEGSRYPITAGRPGSNYSLHQHSSLLSSSLLSLLAAKEGTNSLTLQQINNPLPPSCTVPVPCTDENQHQYCSSSEPSGSTLISVSRTKPPNGYSHSGYPSSAGPSPSLSSSSSSSSSSQPSSNRCTAVQSKSTAFRQPSIAAACHSLSDLVLLNDGDPKGCSCPDGSATKIQALKHLQVQTTSRTITLNPDIPLVKLGRSRGAPGTSGCVNLARNRDPARTMGGEMLCHLQTGTSITRSDCACNSGGVPTVTFGSFQHSRARNYILTDSDDEDSSDNFHSYSYHGYRTSLRPVQQLERPSNGIPRPLLGSFLKNKCLKTFPPPPPLPLPGKVNTRSIVGQSSVLHTSSSKGGGRVRLGGAKTASDSVKKERAASETSQLENGSDAKRLKSGKYQFPDPFESRDSKFCKRVSHFKYLVAQTIRWEQNKQKKKRS